MTANIPISSRRGLAVVVAGIAILSSCRHRPPVERHFLRMPADCAGGLSGMERARWLQDNRRNLPPRKTLKETGFLVLSGTGNKRGTMLRGLELLHVSAGDGTGGLAAVTTSGTSASAPSRLHLLEHRRFTYLDVTNRVLGRAAPAARWKVSPGPKLATASGSSGATVRQVSWDGRTWVAR